MLCAAKSSAVKSVTHAAGRGLGGMPGSPFVSASEVAIVVGWALVQFVRSSLSSGVSMSKRLEDGQVSGSG